MLHHLGSYLSAELVHHAVFFQFAQNAGERCPTATIPSAVTAVKHHKLAGPSAVCAQAAFCREDGGKDSLPAALGTHMACRGQTCTRARADVTQQKGEEGRALKRLVVLGSFPVVPHLQHLPRDISPGCDGAGHAVSYLQAL